MEPEFNLESIPLEVEPEFDPELLQEENEWGRRYLSRGHPGTSYRFRRPPPPQLRLKRRPWAVFPTPYPYPVEPTVSPTAMGSEHIRWVQDCLNQTLGLQLAMTGGMGPETRSAVRSFQRQRGLRVSGIVGPDTEEALRAACQDQTADRAVGGEMQEQTEIGPITTTLTWLKNPNPVDANDHYLFSREQAGRQGGGGVYIVVDATNPKHILKVGKAPSFRVRIGDSSTYRGALGPVGKYKSQPSVPAANLRFYLGRITGFVDPYAHIERAVARLLHRTGEQLAYSRYTAAQPVQGSVALTDILPPPLLNLASKPSLDTAYRGKPTIKGGTIPTEPTRLLLDPVTYPQWELPPVVAGTLDHAMMSKQENIMCDIYCNCPKCRVAREFPWGETETGLHSPFSEAEELELAAELLAVSSEEELEQFLGKLFKGVWKGIKKVGSFVGKVAKPLGGVLKAVAKKALPFVGGALGSFIPIPGVGTALGSALGGALGKALEMEFGRLDLGEQEFEMARRFVQLAGAAARQAALTAPAGHPQQMAEAAVLHAARQLVPNLPASLAGGDVKPSHAMASAHTGRWVRRGNQITVFNE